MGELLGTLRSLRQIPRAHGSTLDEEEVTRSTAAACRVQLAYRNYLKRRVAAVQRIEAAYGRYRLLRGFEAAASEARRVRKRLPFEKALRRRAAAKRDLNSHAAAKLIQSAWRAKKLRAWCRRIDRAARRLQGWLRRQLIAYRIEQEATRLRNRKLRRVVLPPPPPGSQPPPRDAERGKANTAFCLTESPP